MPSPFPGMDPYLERCALWPDVHLSLIAAVRDALIPLVAPAYYVAIDQRVTLVDADVEDRIIRPDVSVVRQDAPVMSASGVGVAEMVETTSQLVDVPFYEEVREGYLEIRDVGTHELVTAIELLSPTNKLSGSGRQEYEEKRRQVLRSRTSLVEIDLLRAGESMDIRPRPTSHYSILVSQGWERPKARLYSFSIREPVPPVMVPLRRSESGALLRLGDLLIQVYERARYDLRVDYRLPPPDPPLSPEDSAWVQALLREKLPQTASGASDAPQNGCA